mmetsp:Transcript_34993/g.48898  ORF Transcript_34993/g.48898 Transcript_34993/m.48898 type:complete len:112 (-) Transcript_34993:639-974(-)
MNIVKILKVSSFPITICVGPTSSGSIFKSGDTAYANTMQVTNTTNPMESVLVNRSASSFLRQQSGATTPAIKRVMTNLRSVMIPATQRTVVPCSIDTYEEKSWQHKRMIRF